jgi:ubiquinone/menaquinone biosynthesis C-methylase UbiE
MSAHLNEEQLQSLASQLSCPSGEQGLKTAENMALSNRGMILSAIDALDLQKGDAVLEIGPGGGSHLKAFFEQAPDLRYTGVDISELMVAEASRFNDALVSEGKAEFLLSGGEALDFSEDTFDKIVTVNTLYFWKDPKQYLMEIKRVLKPGGIFSLCFAPKEFMAKLPFTHYTFNLYTLAEAEGLLKEAGFESLKVNRHDEIVRGNAGQTIERDFLVIAAKKPD